jgi:hypothetical protein
MVTSVGLVFWHGIELWKGAFFGSWPTCRLWAPVSYHYVPTRYLPILTLCDFKTGM